MYVFPQEDCSTEQRHSATEANASGNQFLVLGALIFSSRCENTDSVFLHWGKQITEISLGEIINALVN